MNYIKSTSYSESYPWVQIGTITTQQDALGDTERDDATVKALATAKKVIFNPAKGATAYEWRFRSDGSEDDNNILQLYYTSGVDFYRRLAQLTLYQGTQKHSDGIYFNDDIDVASEAYLDATLNNWPSTADNHYASYGCNIYGNDRFLFIASTLVAETIYIDARRID